MADLLPEFVAWFTKNGGSLDAASIQLTNLPESEGARGVVALKDIPEGHAVFAIPRSLVLSTRTSSLRARIGKAAWWNHGLHEGWAGLILAMMWEAAQGPASPWAPYFDILPTTFDTPMFWSDADLAELQGTSVVEKLGREQAEKDYAEKVRPAIESRPDLFPPADVPTRFSLDMYHLQGSRILSRSFTLQKGRDYDEDGPEEPVEDADAEVGNTSVGSAMDVDSAPPAEAEDHGHDEHGHGDEEPHAHSHGEGEEEEGDEDDEDDDDPGFVAMVPFADMLNARFQNENVKLFYESDCLKMISTKPIKAGEQIWNTYQDLPNSELLRSYGHVDYLPLPGGGFGNPGDVAELRADLIVHALGPAAAKEDMEARIDWWLEEGGDDVFVLELPLEADEALELPPDVLAFTQLIAVDAEWARAQEKGKLPKPVASPATLRVLCAALAARLAQYPTTLEADEERAKNMGALRVNERHALIVRMGEKRVLQTFRAHAEGMLAAAEEKERTGKTKRKAEGGGGGGKRARGG